MGEYLQPLKSLADWREAVTAARNVVNHSLAERVPAKNKIRKSRKAVFLSFLPASRSSGASTPTSYGYRTKRKGKKSAGKHQPEEASVNKKRRKNPKELHPSSAVGAVFGQQPNPGTRRRRRRRGKKSPSPAEAHPESDSSANERSDDSEDSHNSSAEGTRRRRKRRGKKSPSAAKVQPESDLSAERSDDLEDLHIPSGGPVASQLNPDGRRRKAGKKHRPEEASVDESQKDPEEPHPSSAAGAVSSQPPNPGTRRRRRRRGKKSPSPAKVQPESNSSADERQDGSEDSPIPPGGPVASQLNPDRTDTKRESGKKHPPREASVDESQKNPEEPNLSSAAGTRRRRGGKKSPSPAEAQPESDSSADGWPDDWFSGASTPTSPCLELKSNPKDSENNCTQTKEPQLQLFVNNPCGSPLCLQLHPSTSISDLKGLLQDKLGVPPEKQHLFTRTNAELRDNTLSLEDYNIKQDANIELRLVSGLMGGTGDEKASGTKKKGKKSSGKHRPEEASVDESQKDPEEPHPSSAAGAVSSQQSNPVTLNNVILRKISKQIGRWKELASFLNFTDAEVWNFQRNDPHDNAEQAYQMLVDWRNKQPLSVSQVDALCTALKEVDRQDLANILQAGLAHESQQSQDPSVDIFGNPPCSSSQQPTQEASATHSTECNPPTETRIPKLSVWRFLKSVFRRKGSKVRPRNSDDSSAGELGNLARRSVGGATQGATPQTTECPTTKEPINHEVQAAADSCQGELKIHYKSTGSYIQLIPWIDDDKRHITDIYTKLQLESSDEMGEKLKSYHDIFQCTAKEGDLITLAVLVGFPGRGKSTLIDKMAYDWAVGVSHVLQRYKLVFVLKMSALEQSSDLIDAIFDQLLAEDTCVKKEALESFIEKEPERVLILLDGFDELMATSDTRTSVGSIFQILNRKRCRGCFVVVTTRPSHFERLVTNQLVQRPFTYVTVLGFSKDDVKGYVWKFFSVGAVECMKGLLERIESSAVLSDLAQSPMLLLLMCLLWGEDSTLPETMSRLYTEAVRYIFRRKLDSSQKEILDLMIGIGKVGLRGLLSPDQVLSLREGDFEGSLLEKALKVGILTRQRVIKRLNSDNIIHFIHKTFQEFCAAKYLQSLLEGDTATFKKTLDQIMSTNPLDFEYLLRFCCGDNEVCTNRILRSLVERHSLSLQNKLGQLGLHCYHEGQSATLPPVEFIHSIITEHMTIERGYNQDCLNSLVYFLNYVASQTKESGNEYLGRVQEVKFSEVNLDRLAKYLAHSMSAMINLQSVTLSRCFLNANSVQDITSALSNAKNLTELNIARCDGYKPSAVAWSSLKHLKCLQKLDLSFSRLRGKRLKHIMKSLSDLPNFVDLNVSLHHSQRPAPSVWSCLKHLECLQKLDLSNCSLTGKHWNYIARSLSGLPNLVKLNVSKNKLHGSTAVLWSCLKHLKCLQELDLSNCSLTGKHWNYIARSLSGLPNLIKLNVSKNELHGSTAVLWSCLKHLKCLQELDLSNCSLTGKHWEHIAESMSSLPNLVKLNVSGNTLGGSPAAAWSCFQHLKCLQKLNLSCCCLNVEDVKQIAESLSGLPNLVEFDLADNNLQCPVYLLASPLQYLEHLKWLDCEWGTIHADKEYLDEVLGDLYERGRLLMDQLSE